MRWGALWAEAIPPLPQAPGPPRPGLVPISIIGAEDEDFENELKTVRGRWGGRASVPGPLGPQPSSPVFSVPSPTLGPVLCLQMLSLSLLSLPISLSLIFLVPPSSSPHPIVSAPPITAQTLTLFNPSFYRCPRPLIAAQILIPSLLISVLFTHHCNVKSHPFSPTPDLPPSQQRHHQHPTCQLGSIGKCRGRGRVKPQAPPLLPTVSLPSPPPEPRGAKQPVPEPGSGEAAPGPPHGPPAARGHAVRARTPGEGGAG